MSSSYICTLSVILHKRVLIRATFVSELVQGGEKTLREGLGSDNVNAAKLNDPICAQLCDAGMQALEKATRSALVLV